MGEIVEVSKENCQRNKHISNQRRVLSQIFHILFLFSNLIGPLTHTKDEITTVYGIVHGPGSFPVCAATAIFTKVSAPEILNWITKETGKLAKSYLRNILFIKPRVL